MRLRFPIVAASLAVLVIASSCSRQARARRSLSESRACFEKAKIALLSGEAASAQPLAKKSLDSAERAMHLLPPGSSRETVSKQMETSKLLFDAFDDPLAAVNLWAQAIRQADVSLAVFVMDYRSLINEFFGGRIERLPAAEMKAFDAQIEKSSQISVEHYADLAATWQFEDIRVSKDGDTAQVALTMKVVGLKRPMIFWLNRQKGFWRICDITHSGVRMSDTFAKMSGVYGKNADCLKFFEGKGLLEAFSEVQEIGQAMAVFGAKFHVGHYCKPKANVILKRGEKDVEVGPETLLKVIDESPDDQGILLAGVRTTEADMKECAMGRLPMDAIKILGTDESEMWGLEGLETPGPATLSTGPDRGPE